MLFKDKSAPYDGIPEEYNSWGVPRISAREHSKNLGTQTLIYVPPGLLSRRWYILLLPQDYLLLPLGERLLLVVVE